MGQRGPLPSSDPSKLRGHRKPEPWTTVTEKKRKPLRKLTQSSQYCPRTRGWWDTMAALPVADLWGEDDWQMLEDAADLMDTYYLSNDPREQAMVLKCIRADVYKPLGILKDGRERSKIKLLHEESADDRQERGAAAKRTPRSTRRDPRLRAIEGGRGA